MPSRKRTNGPPSVESVENGEPERDSEAYRQKRQRNNDAVKKTRAKSKETAKTRRQNVEKLKQENLQLEAEIRQKKENVEVLKGLLLNHVEVENREEMIQRILAEPSDDEADGDL